MNRETHDNMVFFLEFLRRARTGVPLHNSFPDQAEQGQCIGEILHGHSRCSKFGHGVHVQEPLGPRSVVTVQHLYSNFQAKHTTAGTSGYHHGFRHLD